jgi:hypothetical protein
MNGYGYYAAALTIIREARTRYCWPPDQLPEA